ncbi:MAG TPA: DUF3006 domain-containing protein [Ruminococcaceae bacterium]|nr:DUF3006 domain-containing protein [Oscillospiraceae bacterium]
MLYIDRIEDGFAVCEQEDGSFVSLSLSDLPEGVKDGSVLNRDEQGRLFLDLNAEEKRRNALFNLQDSLFDE